MIQWVFLRNKILTKKQENRMPGKIKQNTCTKRTHLVQQGIKTKKQ